MVQNLMRFPSWSNPKLWHKEDGFIKRKESLLPYFMSPSGGISNDGMEDLLGKIMVGIDNSEAWKAVLGFDISKREFGGNIFQVSVNARSMTQLFMIQTNFCRLLNLARAILIGTMNYLKLWTIMTN